MFIRILRDVINMVNL